MRSLEDIAIVALGVATGVVYWLVTRWKIEDGDLRIETGLIKRSSLRFPLTQIQAIDIVRPGVARVLGLSELRLRTAGSTGAHGRLAYLTERDAETLRTQLLALAHRLEPDVEAPAEQILLRVSRRRLAASLALSGIGLALELALLALVVAAIVRPHLLLLLIGPGFVVGAAIALTFWRRLNGMFDFTVAEAPDGLRLRAGLVATAAETIPRGRVQAVRMTEPLLWRRLGWCRLYVDVAGKQRSKREGTALSGSLRELMPVGTRAEARLLLERVIVDPPVVDARPPRRAFLMAPLRYHFLGWGYSTTCAVTTTGRTTRATDWVPLGKLQSIRRVQGPQQRLLRLATVHLDTAGANIHAAFREARAGDAEAALFELAERAGPERSRAR
ncbi:MAG: putative rane protein [Gaiellaceae bacterium]|nr:putative rane protein [Gaiellaceae bacterium]